MTHETVAATTGGQRISVLHLRDTRGVSSYIAEASAHKRSLSASFNSWSSPNRDRPGGLLGPAGEIVTQRSLAEAAGAGVGYLLLGREKGEVRQVFGEDVPGGPLDNAAFLQLIGSDGMPTSVFAPIEVKNVRHWIYPRSKELHQLSHKAALLQSQHPDHAMAPVLICRKKSILTYWMSREIGFRVVETNRQYLLPHADVQDHILAAAQRDLGFSDLVRTADPDPTVVGIFKDNLLRRLPA